jgi:probable F420-dependent oxidoreductase
VNGRYGIWSGSFRGRNRDNVAAAAGRLEDMGWTSLWVPGGADDEVLEFARAMLSGTTSATVATGILNIWMHDPVDVRRTVAELDKDSGGRFLLGLGVGHAPSVDASEPGRYRQPVAAMGRFLDALDDGDDAVPPSNRVVAALGPRMLDVARERSAGSHTYHAPVAHTAAAREALGPDALLVPEVAVVVDEDADRARTIARAHLAGYARLPNYANNWLRYGFTEDDVAGEEVSDRLVDGLVAHGGPDRIADRCAEHLEAGATAVCLQVLTATGTGRPFDEWAALARALGL